MKEPVELIDEMLEDHATIVKNAEEACSDAAALTALSQADTDFSPGRRGRAEVIKKLQSTVENCDAGVAEHFAKEETGPAGNLHKSR